MGLWNKSEDPWDRRERRQERPVSEEKESRRVPLTETVQSLRERVKTAMAPPVSDTPPIKCPWCGGEMVQGWLSGGERWGIRWCEGLPGWKDKLLGSDGADGRLKMTVDSEGGLYRYAIAWYCRECEKLVVEHVRPQAPPEDQWQTVTEKTTEE